MSTVPTCPKHQSGMRAGKYPGTWFCPRVVGQDEEGKNIYCSERLKGQIQPNPDPVTFQKPQQATQDALGSTIYKVGQSATDFLSKSSAEAAERLNEQIKWQSAFVFSGQVFHGTGKAAEALELAAAARALLP